MLIQLAIGLILTVPCVLVHAAGFVGMLYWLEVKLPSVLKRFALLNNIFLICRVVGVMLGLHVAEIVIWAGYYSWQGCFEDFQTSLYFSFSAYTTAGYGDLVLPPTSRLVGSIETCIGLLLFGVSTAFFWSFVSRFLTERRLRHTQRRGLKSDGRPFDPD